MPLFDKFIDSPAKGARQESLKSIVKNLNNVLNTRKGFGSFLRDYGIRDLCEYASQDQLSMAIMEEVRHCIEQYEPRLDLVGMTIKNDNDPFRISFDIECRVQETSRMLLMEFDSVHSDFNIKDS